MSKFTIQRFIKTGIGYHTYDTATAASPNFHNCYYWWWHSLPNAFRCMKRHYIIIIQFILFVMCYAVNYDHSLILIVLSTRKKWMKKAKPIHMYKLMRCGRKRTFTYTLVHNLTNVTCFSFRECNALIVIDLHKKYTIIMARFSCS